MNSENDQSEARNIADSLLAWIGVALIEKAAEVREEALSSLSALLEIAVKKDDSSYKILEAAIEMHMNHSMMLVVEWNGSSGVSRQRQLQSLKSLIGRTYAS
jgi:hypothetical protein